MGLKLFGEKGIDQRDNHLVKDQTILRDGRNIRSTKSDGYRKRDGQETYEPNANFDTSRSEDFIYIKETDSYFYFDGTDYWDTKKGKIDAYVGTATGSSKKLSAVESLGSLLFVHVDDPLAVMKYDGHTIYYAGLPAVTLQTGVVSSSGTFQKIYNLMYYSFLDNNQVQIDGPAQILDTPGYFKIDKSALDGFHKPYIEVDEDTILGPGYTRTITNKQGNASADLRGTKLKVGDKVPIRSFANSAPIAGPGTSTQDTSLSIYHKDDLFMNPFHYKRPRTITLWLEIESIDVVGVGVDRNITFTAESFGDFIIVTDKGSLGTRLNLHCGLVIKRWVSSSEFTGYVNNPETLCINYTPTLDNIEQKQIRRGSSFFPLSETKQYESLLSGEYDLNSSKLRPPVCKYLFMYGYQLICGNVLGFYDFNNQLTNYTNDDLVMYSDLLLGDTPESFSENNRQLIGETQDGQIMGLGRVNDSLMVFKDRGVHALDGVLLSGQYSKRTLRSNGIGLTSFKSILEVDDSLFFQGRDGVYATDGYEIVNVSRNVFKMFEGIDATKTRAAFNAIESEAMFYVEKSNGDSFIFVLNTENGSVFLWDGMNASKGLLVSNSDIVTLWDARVDNKVIKMNSTLKDISTPINAWIKTAWIDLGEPGLLKKINGFRLYCFENKGQKIDFRMWNDWTESRLNVSSQIEEFSTTSVKSKNQKTGTFTGQSFSIELKNNIIDEDLMISGYELETAVNQTKDKNVY